SPLSLTVNPAGTFTSVVSSVNPSVFGQSVTFTATVTSDPPLAVAETGSVSFFDGATLLATMPLSNGSAAYSSSSLAVAGHSITATYSGDSNYAGSTSPALTQTVNAAATSTSVSSSLNPSTFGQSVTFTATVTANAPGAGTPTGTVT